MMQTTELVEEVVESEEVEETVDMVGCGACAISNLQPYTVRGL